MIRALQSRARARREALSHGSFSDPGSPDAPTGLSRRTILDAPQDHARPRHTARGSLLVGSPLTLALIGREAHIEPIAVSGAVAPIDQHRAPFEPGGQGIVRITGTQVPDGDCS